MVQTIDLHHVDTQLAVITVIPTQGVTGRPIRSLPRLEIKDWSETCFLCILLWTKISGGGCGVGRPRGNINCCSRVFFQSQWTLRYARSTAYSSLAWFRRKIHLPVLFFYIAVFLFLDSGCHHGSGLVSNLNWLHWFNRLFASFRWTADHCTHYHACRAFAIRSLRWFLR